jgi:prevent-host-death family protein
MDHGHRPWYDLEVDTLPISRFKTTCLAALERVRKTGRPLLVTRRGVPIAQVIPAPPPKTKEETFGAMRGTAEELKDIVAPLPAGDWEALR